MTDAAGLVKKLNDLDARVRSCSSQYYHSRPFVSYAVEHKGANAASISEVTTLDLRDVLVASAISSNNVLFSGASGEGKTHLAKMVMTALFGTGGYAILPIDASFGIDKMRDMAFDDIRQGKHLKEAVRETGFLTLPGVIVDEYNRAPSEITNMLQGYLQNGSLVFEGGREVVPGVVLDQSSSERYQWKVATVNEGSRYIGARRIDAASRDRLAVEIPLDIFPPTNADKRKLTGKTSSGVEVTTSDVTAQTDLFELVKGVRDVPLSGPLQEFILYLSRMNQCIRTPNNTKLEIENFSPEYCKGCHLSKNKSNMCGSVYAPSSRSLINLQNLARAFALFRYARSTDKKSLSADVEDLQAAAPFVLYSKIAIHPGWIDTEAGGSRWSAVNAVLNNSFESFRTWFHKNQDHLRTLDPRSTATEEEKQKSRSAIKKYAKENDAWSAEPPFPAP